jgi:RNA recognition motif-containing protein
MNIYVGSLSYEVTEEELMEAFQAFGTVESVNIIKDKFTGRSRGFGAQAAIDGLNGQELKGRRLNVNKARPRSDRGGGGRPRQGGWRRSY